MEAKSPLGASLVPGVRAGAGVLSLVAVLAATLFTLGAGAALKSHCAAGAWKDGRQYRDYCYSDIVPLYRSEHLTGGRLPYLDACHSIRPCDEYPPVTMYFLRAAAWLSSSPASFFWVNVAALSVLGLLTAWFPVAARRPACAVLRARPNAAAVRVHELGPRRRGAHHHGHRAVPAQTRRLVGSAPGNRHRGEAVPRARSGGVRAAPLPGTRPARRDGDVRGRRRGVGRDQRSLHGGGDALVGVLLHLQRPPYRRLGQRLVLGVHALHRRVFVLPVGVQ